ncbi:hypothetical protein RUM44_010352 [Polyplax serrata]|uniref:Rho-GAP domain-containing protein n=1 Tax=Polyplax serrata TaxID=468196 RepID=A0ABR1AX29_POLSC
MRTSSAPDGFGHSTQATRDLWWNKLSEVVAIEREKEPKSTNIQVLYNDVSTGIEYVKTFSIGPHDTATRCIALALDHLEMRGLNAAEFQLWAKTSREEAPYPLIGHERPFSIKLSCLREGLSTEEGFDLDHCNNVHGPDALTRCQFILRNTRRTAECPNSEGKKDRKKNRKSPMRIRHVFRRSVNKEDCVDHFPGVLFGQPLSKVTDGDLPPPPVMSMFQQVFQKGPFTQGIFRKSANARLVRELRDKLDNGEDVQLDVVPVLVTAALLKEFMRSLPEPLLGSALYPLWLDALNCSNQSERLLRLKSLVEQLPKTNQTLLAHFLCVLHHIARKSSLNLMSAGNLGVCVGPSLLWTPCMTPAGSKAVPALVEALVTHCEVIIGPHVPHLLGDPPERPQDSGAEESDSLHSGGLRRDDSSIDSLERELLDPPRKDKMSLSRDSGLTMSDSQLYTPDEEESTSSSSCGSGRGVYSSTTTPTHNANFHAHNKVSPSYSVPGGNSNLGPSALTATSNREYVRVYGGWEERVQDCCRNRSNSIYAQAVRSGVINSNFQRQDWFRQRSQLKRLNSGGTAPDAGNRSASQESLLTTHAKDEMEVSGRQGMHCKDRTQQPMPTPLPRSKSSHHLFTTHTLKESPRNMLRRTVMLDPATVTELHDGMSSSHMDGDRSYDSSTLSDDDSTPHVSRSNSRGKDCTVSVDQVYSLCDERLVHAAPAQVTVDPPPLPPKRAPLRHLPPVHVDPLPDDKKPSERRGRLRQRELAHKTAAHRSKSLPPPEEHSRSRDRADQKWSNVNGETWNRSVYDESSYSCKVQDVSRTKKDGRSAHKNIEQSRTSGRDELTMLENTLPTLQKSRTIEIPPPYRPPPTVGSLNSRAPITTYHLREALSRRIVIDKGDHQEESYV